MKTPTRNTGIVSVSGGFHRRRNDQVLAAVTRLIEYGALHSSTELLREFLDEAEALSGSSVGFFHFVEEDQKTISLQMWSTNTLKTCLAPGAGTHYPIDQAGVWVECIHTGQSVIHNDYARLHGRKGLPEGHVPLVRELVVPVIRGGLIKAVLGVGNKAIDYDAEDLGVVEQLARLAWDVIGRKRAEEEIRQLQVQFAQAQKMDAIGRLAGGVAHDYNNMLSVIIGQVEMAQEKDRDAQRLQDELKSIREAAERSVNLTRQLLAFARKQSIAPVVLNLNRAVGETLKMLRRMIGEDIGLVWKPGADLGMVKMDPVQVDQILVNLCVNARDAIHGVGQVVIETRNADFDAVYCTKHFDVVPGRYVMLSVSDDGCGMDRETVGHIFEPFFTTKAAGAGTGLGLSTVYGIVKQNGGFVNVYSELGRGTCLKIYLARCDGEAVKKTQDFAGVARGAGETILVVEDEEKILDVALKMLGNLGYRVLAARSPARALRMVQEAPTGIDLLITDVVMPEMGGLDLAERIRALCPEIKVIFMSGYLPDAAARQGIHPEAPFLQKPFSRADLGGMVRDVLGKKRRGESGDGARP